MKPMRSVLSTLICGLAFAAFAALAAASPITYYYTGTQYTSFTGGLSCGALSQCNLTGSMTLSSAFGPNAFINPAAPTAFSFSDGATTFDNSNSHLVNALFATDASGNIAAWVFSGELNASGATWYQSANWPQPDADHDLIQTPTGASAASSSAGAWSDTPAVVTPEPASWLLLATGALILLGAGVRRRPALGARWIGN